MKIHILYNIQNGAWGGGNQFLHMLRDYLSARSLYTNNPLEADTIIVNSKDNLKEAAELSSQGKACIHRVDGIFSLYRGENNKHLDEQVYEFSKNYAKGVIYQSKWSKQEHQKRGATIHRNETIIHNCAKQCFANVVPSGYHKINIVATSWSDNPKKGFDVYKFLDDNLDFGKYDFMFIGRSPISFSNILPVGVLNSEQIADLYCNAHIYVTATEYDACSNAIIEALTAKLPVVALNSGGNPELVKNGGELFEGKEDIIDKISMVADDPQYYRDRIEIGSIEDVCSDYLEFIRCCQK